MGLGLASLTFHRVEAVSGFVRYSHTQFGTCVVVEFLGDLVKSVVFEYIVDANDAIVVGGSFQ